MLSLNSKIGSEKSPIKSAVVRCSICFDSKYMVNMQDSASKKFLTLQKVPSAEYVEEVEEHNPCFIKHVVTAKFEKSESFGKFKQRIDKFWGSFLSQKYVVMLITF